MDMMAAGSVARVIATLDQQEVSRFVEDKLAQKRLHDVIADLNDDILSKDPARTAPAESALRRMGFL